VAENRTQALVMLHSKTYCK